MAVLACRIADLAKPKLAHVTADIARFVAAGP